MTGLATQLAEAQFAGRNQALQAKSDLLTKQISTAGTIRSQLSQFASALGDRLRTGDLAPTPSIGNSAVAKVSSPLGAIGKGSYQLEVSQLASNQVLTGPAYSAATDTVGAGTLTIRFGATSNSGFTEDTSHQALSIDIAAGATLSDVASAINGQNAGLTAYVAQTQAGAQLVVKGAEGLQNGFVIEASEDSNNPGLSALAWQPGSDPTRLTQTSQDAEYKLDGLLSSSASNTIANAAPGLSLTLTGTNAGAPTTVSFANPTSAISSAMEDITGALNEIVSSLRDATDPQTGDLARDSGARALSRTLSGFGTTVIMPNAPAGAPRTLSELGLAIQRDGSFQFDSSKLSAAIARDPEGVAAMFTTGLDGVYSTIDRISRTNSISSDPGSLAGSIARYTSQSKQVAEDLSKLADQQATLRANMVARFAKADSQVTDSKSTLSFLQSQIAVWNAQKN